MRKKSYSKSLGVGCITLICVCSTCFADLTNGNFSTPDLYGWTVEYGTVADGGAYALFEEDASDLSSTLSQVFTIPGLALELSFDVQMWSVPGGPYEPFALADAFLVSLLDPLTFDPLISNPGFIEFYYFDNTGYQETVGTVSGNTVALDVSSLAGTDVFLSFDLWGGLDGMETSVSLDNVNISVVPAPGALLLGLIGTGTSVLGLWRRLRNPA